MLEKELERAVKSNKNDELMKVYQEIYYQYYKLIYFCISRYSLDQESLKDLVNDTFVNFFNSSDKINGSIKNYLTKIARNLTINYLKKNQKIINLDDEKLLNISVESNSKYLELVNDLKTVLTPLEVDLILLHVVDGYTFKELENKFQIKAKSLNKIYERAIKKYREVKEHE